MEISRLEVLLILGPEADAGNQAKPVRLVVSVRLMEKYSEIRGILLWCGAQR
jgi:hypothetical protein